MEAPARPIVVPTALAAAGALAVALIGVRGPDYPAHYLRAELWDRAGAAVWNFTWYGGHATPSYSVLMPPVVSTVGPVVVNVLAAIVSTFVVAKLIGRLAGEVGPVPRTLAAAAFAAGTVVNVIVGRTAFAAGLTVLLLSLWAWAAGRPRAAIAAAVLAPLITPVVAAFGAIIAAAVGLDALLDRRRATVVRAGGVLAALVVPLGLMSVLFRDGGRFPYRAGHLVFSLVLMAVTALGYRSRVLQLAAGLAAVSSVVLFAVPNPLGGNFTRFAQYLVVPVAVLAAARVPRLLSIPVAALALVGVWWTVQHGLEAERQWSGDAAIDASYHAPLIDELLRRNADGQPLGRVEIPFTDTHWESYYVAPHVPYARGWERQTDLGRNAELYDTGLTAGEYRDWLAANAVRWVAVPDVTLDEGGRPEGALIAGGLDWLTPVWSNANWTLYEVAGYTPVVDAPAELVSQRVDELVVRTGAPAEVTLRYHYTADMTVDGGACVAPADDSPWTTLRLPEAGEFTVSVGAGALLGGDVAACA